MKELSIEQKAKAYDDAFNRAKSWYTDAQIDFKKSLETLFPGLKCDDEKIRKEIIKCVKNYGPSSANPQLFKNMLAWLEKQEGCEHIKKDWLEHIKQSWYKEGFIDGKYSGGTSKKWTINDTTTLNELIDFLENGTAKLQHDLTRYANWLKIQFTPIEKQGEQKSADSYCQENCKGFQETGKCFADGMCKAKREAESVEKAEPKFKIGNWIVDKSGLTQQVLDFRGGIYTCTYNSFTTDCESNYHLWNIQDAKHGDVLAYDTVVLIFDHLGTFENRPIIYSWYFADSKKFYGMGTSDPDRWEVEGFYPATKEQRTELFLKMHEAGYEWDAEKKELKKFHVIDEGKSEMGYCFNKMINGEKVTPAWSEKDEDYINDLIKYFSQSERLKNTKEDIVIWLKSIKYKVQPQSKQEWSSWDELQYKAAYNLCENSGHTVTSDWLKSIKQRIGWRPSEEQMDALETAVSSLQSTALESLYNDLKKI